MRVWREALAKTSALTPKGDRLTTVVFTCAKRLSTLPPGQRVYLELMEDIGEHDGAGVADRSCVDYEGTVMRPSRRYPMKILVWLDNATERGRNPIAVRPNRVTPLDEPLRKLCPDCQQPEGTQPTEHYETYPHSCPRCAGWVLEKNRLGYETWVEPPAEAVTAGDQP